MTASTNKPEFTSLYHEAEAACGKAGLYNMGMAAITRDLILYGVPCGPNRDLAIKTLKDIIRDPTAYAIRAVDT